MAIDTSRHRYSVGSALEERDVVVHAYLFRSFHQNGASLK